MLANKLLVWKHYNPWIPLGTTFQAQRSRQSWSWPFLSMFATPPGVPWCGSEAAQEWLAFLLHGEHTPSLCLKDAESSCMELLELKYPFRKNTYACRQSLKMQLCLLMWSTFAAALPLIPTQQQIAPPLSSPSFYSHLVSNSLQMLFITAKKKKKTLTSNRDN